MQVHQNKLSRHAVTHPPRYFSAEYKGWPSGGSDLVQTQCSIFPPLCLWMILISALQSRGGQRKKASQWLKTAGWKLKSHKEPICDLLSLVMNLSQKIKEKLLTGSLKNHVHYDVLLEHHQALLRLVSINRGCFSSDWWADAVSWKWST